MHTQHGSLLEDIDETYHQVVKETQEYFMAFTNHFKDKERKRTAKNRQLMVQANKDIVIKLRTTQDQVDSLREKNATLTKEKAAQLEQSQKDIRELEDRKNTELHDAKESLSNQHKKDMEAAQQRAEKDKEAAVAAVEKKAKDDLASAEQKRITEVTQVKNELDALKQKVRSQEDEIDALQAQCDTLQAQLKAGVAQGGGSAGGSAGSATVVDSSAQIRVFELESELRKEKRVQQRREDELNDLQREHAKLTAEYKSFLAGVSTGNGGSSSPVESSAPPASGSAPAASPEDLAAIEAKINDKKNELAKVEKNHSGVAKKKKVLKKEIFAWTKEFEAKEGRKPGESDRGPIAEQISQYKVISKEEGAVSKEKESLQGEITELEAELERMRQGGASTQDVAKTDSESAAAPSATKSSSINNNDNNNAAVAALKLQLLEKDEQIRNMQSKHRQELDNETRKSGKDDQVVEDLKKQLVKLTEDRNKLAKDLEDSKAGSQRSGDQLRESGGASSTALKQKCAQLQNQNEKLKAKLADAKEKGFVDDGDDLDPEPVTGGEEDFPVVTGTGGGMADEELVAENEDLRDQVERAGREVTAAEEKLSQREDAFDKQISDKNDEISKLREQLNDAQTAGITDEGTKKTIVDLRNDKTSLEGELEELRVLLQTKDDEIVELRNNTAAPVYNFAPDSDDEGDTGDAAGSGGGSGGRADPAELEELRAQLREADAAHEKEISDLRAQIAAAQSDAGNDHALVAEKNAEIQRLTDEHESRERNLQSEIEALKKELASAEQQAAETRVNLVEAQIAAASAKGEDTASLEKDLSKEKAAKAEADKEAEAKVKASEEAASAAKKEDEAKIAELNAEIAKLTSAYAKLDAEHKQLESELKNTKGDLAKAKTAAKKGGSTRSSARAGAAGAAAGGAVGGAAATKENAKLKRELNKLAQQLKKTEDKLKRANEKAATGESHARDSRAAGKANQQAEMQLRKAEQKIEQQQKKIQQLEEKLKSTPKADPKKEAQMEAKMGKTESKYQKQIADLEAKGEKDLAALEKKKQAEIDKLTKELENATASSGEAMEKLKTDLKGANKALKDTEAELNEVKGQLDALQKESAADKEELEALRVAAGEAAQLQSRVAELESEAEKAGKKYATLEENFQKEALLRKKYHNIIEDLKGKIRVIVRARPLSKKELARGCASVVSFPDAYTINIEMSKGTKSFQFDTAFGPDSTQVQVFEDVKNLCLSAIDGYNVCIFAYGQTGSGKTFTMAGEGGDLEGITPRAMREIYTLANGLKKRANVSIQAYMMEIYNDKLVDLLQPDRKKPPRLDIKKDAKGMIFVAGSVLKAAPDATVLQAIIDEGSKRRHVAATAMNEGSSRSHLILGIVIEVVQLKDKKKTIGKLSLVDLAGSERVGKTGATADRLKEAQSINRSLSALGDVISALSTEEKFIPYRNNKLTLLMSDSLGGNAKTLMFVNISPADYNMDESFLSMSYAQRVKMITNDASKNVENKEVQKLKAVIAKLRKAGAVIPEEDDIEQTLTVDEVAFENQKESVHDLSLANKTVGSEGPNAEAPPPEED
eukprot:TRINITY_DN11459_c0_g1_i1.p1 TRINITY_DN11459_c0_g1~~TRINITY_DN11459_c0_g1_i1.p1  ORF type:complete len:1569 (-),score=597.25 TRINITY_DN11459_c0_g1_i1:127-4833(-)